MSDHLKSYLARLDKEVPGISESVQATVNAVVLEYIETFDYQSELTGLLLGNVQSGKTSHTLGIVSASANLKLDLFILLTTDNTKLQQQTLNRALQYLDTFTVCGETDEMRFNSAGMRKPAIIVLKKNARVLQTWRNNLSSSGFCSGRPIFIIDDEGDAASLNTKINQEDQSTINRYLEEIKHLGGGPNIYLQVTATPQSILLQREETGWRPSFIHYFPPGHGYLGGNFLYSDPQSYAIRTIAEDELDHLLDNEATAAGMQVALASFLISGAHILLSGQAKVCNFLVHPSVRTNDHEAVTERIGEYLNLLLDSIREDSPEIHLQEVWEDIQSTKPDLLPLERIGQFIHEILENEDINMVILNSRHRHEINDTGLNIIVGGNTLGRGVTFSNLQTVYYCRRAKVPQADTFWQHSRMFGYDRDRELMRVFLPPSLLVLFTQINQANQAIIEQVATGNIDNIQLLSPPGTRPTRPSVVDKDARDLIVGGVNYFPFDPDDEQTDVLDQLLSPYTSPEYDEATSEEAIEILQYLESKARGDWSGKTYINCIKAIEAANRHSVQVILIVRRDRNIGRRTGTLLSPNDRDLGNNFGNRVVLTLYRVRGGVDKGWNGNPLWIPNIKLPRGQTFHYVN